MTFSAADAAFMARALQLAERGRYTTAPNPQVGCVLVQGNAVIGEGWHEVAGEAHAEVMALRAAGANFKGATAYVTLEPCAHQGRTGPCAQALIEAKLARVVVAMNDPNPLVAGRGIAMLRAAGMAVETGLMRAEAECLNRGFCSRMRRQRPWLCLKLAQSLDGRTALANGVSQWISGPAARADVQWLRARAQAIICSSNTVLADNARLTVRLNPEDFPAHTRVDALLKPLRVVLDSKARVPVVAAVRDHSAPTLMVHASAAQDNVGEHLLLANEYGQIDLAKLLNALAARGVNDGLLECGPRLAGAFMQAGLVDEIVLYMAPVFMGDSARALLQLPVFTQMQELKSWRYTDVRQIGADLRLCLQPEPV